MRGGDGVRGKRGWYGRETRLVIPGIVVGMGFASGTNGKGGYGDGDGYGSDGYGDSDGDGGTKCRHGSATGPTTYSSG